MATEASEPLLDGPGGLTMIRYPPILKDFRRAFKSEDRRVRKSLFANKSGEVREDYAVVMRLLLDLVNQVISVDDKSILPRAVNRIQSISLALKAIEPEEGGNDGETIKKLRREIDACFAECGLIPAGFVAPDKQTYGSKLHDPAPMLGEVLVEVKTCVEATSVGVSSIQKLRDGDRLRFLRQRLKGPAKPLYVDSRLFLQERRRHFQTKSGITWRLLRDEEEFRDLPTTEERKEVFIFDRADEYVVAVVGHDSRSPDPPRDDFAIAIAVTDKVHDKVERHLPNIDFKYKRGSEEEAVWLGTPKDAKMECFDCGLLVITS